MKILLKNRKKKLMIKLHETYRNRKAIIKKIS